jgi:uncharacterized C2H2 Zn-finger protein
MILDVLFEHMEAIKQPLSLYSRHVVGEIMAVYTCKYCGDAFEKPLDLARHVRKNHKRSKRRSKRLVEKPVLPAMSKAREAVGVLKGLQAAPNLSAEEKKLLDEVAKTVEALLTE